VRGNPFRGKEALVGMVELRMVWRGEGKRVKLNLEKGVLIKYLKNPPKSWILVKIKKMIAIQREEVSSDLVY